MNTPETETRVRFVLAGMVIVLLGFAAADVLKHGQTVPLKTSNQTTTLAPITAAPATDAAPAPRAHHHHRHAAPAQAQTEERPDGSSSPHARSKRSGKLSSPADGTIDINTASEEDLQKIPHIGPAMAKRIIEYRNTAQSFRSLEELRNVKGIGEKTLEKIEPYMRLK
jgi:competence protein ComEA